MDRSVSRRTVLAGGAAGMASLAGCGLFNNPESKEAALYGATPASEGTGWKIKLGVLAPQTGYLKPFGREITDAVRLVKRQVDVSRNGFRVGLSIKDTESDPQIAVSKARELVDEGYQAVVGPAREEAVEEVTRKVFVPETIAASTPLGGAGTESLDDEDLVFVTAPTHTQLGTSMTRPLALQEVQTASIIYEQTQYGELVKDTVTTAFEARRGTVTNTVGIEPGGSSYTSAVREATSEEIDGTVVVAGADAIRITKDYYAEGGTAPLLFSDRGRFPDLPAQVTSDMKNDRVLSLRPEWFRDQFYGETETRTLTDATPTPTLASDDADLLKAFLPAFRAAYGRIPLVQAAQAFDATVMLVLAAAAATQERYDGAEIAGHVRQVVNQKAGSLEGVRMFEDHDYWKGLGIISEGIRNVYAGPSSNVELNSTTGVLQKPPMHLVKWSSGTGTGFEEILPLTG